MAYAVDRTPPAGLEQESWAKRALRWIEVPAAYALISALSVHLLLRLLPVGRSGGVGLADAAASIAAVTALLAAVALRAWGYGRGR